MLRGVQYVHWVMHKIGGKSETVGENASWSQGGMDDPDYATSYTYIQL